MDGPILDESSRLIRFLTLQDADMLVRRRAEQSEIAANYVKAVSQEDFNHLGYNGSNGSLPSQNGNVFSQRYNPTFQNGIGFDNGNGLWSSEQGFAIGGQEKLSRSNGYLSELAAAAFVCRVSSLIRIRLLNYLFTMLRLPNCNMLLVNLVDNKEVFRFSCKLASLCYY